MRKRKEKVSISLNSKTLKRVNQEAKRMGISRSQFIETVIREMIGDEYSTVKRYTHDDMIR